MYIINARLEKMFVVLACPLELKEEIIGIANTAHRKISSSR
jgi:hypothetical protein